MVNRCFDVTEMAAGPASVDAHLDREPKLIDPSEQARSIELLAAQASGGAERTAAIEKLGKAMHHFDVPPVEDFPIAPESDDPGFAHLEMMLRLRSSYAVAHWQGKTELSFGDIVAQVLKGER